ncbi:uncharacterized protein EV154DRAFT_488612 [Mucor mucedo]|uniref:uncharacterized protein n=1 Tax=Mucor mucedo TaxID=29922 RepID=UPI002220EA8C|nr:uncharacterized protein EV154DRAFT_488612 [Mucor mucedo]KAI7866100.1 hypothetical protein EV154DRAFT_488612 [Mucor mucedo]
MRHDLVGLPETYKSTVVQNVGMHLLNFKLWIICFLRGFLNYHRQQTRVSIPAKTIAGKASNAIVTHKSFSQAELRVSYSISYARISGPKAMYGLFALAQKRNLNGSELYTQYELKEELWKNMFDLDKVEKKRLCNCPSLYHATAESSSDKQSRFAFSLGTDGHMASLLFEGTKRFRVPQNKEDLRMLTRRIDLSTVKRGLYPLSKNPIGLQINDRLIGIDPSVRDIVTVVDCEENVMTNKQTTKKHFFPISYRSYK